MANVVYFNDGVKLPCCPTLLESLYLSASGTCAGDCNANYTGFVAGNLSYNIVYTLPTASGTSGQVLTTDGNNNLSWTTVSGGGGGGTPAGIDGYIQYNNGGSFGGASILYWNDLNSRLGIGTATPNQTLEVAGTMRLTGSTGTPVSILGRDANGDISNVALGSNFLLSGGTLSLSGVTVSGYVPYTGATQNVNLGSFSLASSGVTTPYLQISTAGSSTPMQEGMLRWNDTDRTYEFMMGGGNVLQQIGQELPVPVKHVDNAGLENGKVVYYVSSDGTNKLVRYAIASGESESAGVFGLMTEDASGGNKALCTTFGYVRDIDTSTLEEGKIVWLSDTELGGMTTTRPTQPSHGVQVGFCIRQHATEGAIFVSIQNGYELDELHNVLISSGITDQEMLFYNSALKVWQNKTAAAANLVSGSGTATQVAFWKSGSTNEIEGSPNLYWDNVNTRLGLGTSTPLHSLDLLSGNAKYILRLGQNTSNTDGSWTGIKFQLSTNVSNVETTDGAVNLRAYRYAVGNEFRVISGASTTATFGAAANGLGIGVTPTVARLQVQGADTSDSNWTAQFHNSLGNSNSLMIRNDGNVGIGTTGTTARLVVRGSGATSTTTTLLLQNSGGSQLLTLDDSGQLKFGTQSINLMPTSNGSSVGLTGRGLLLTTNIGTATNIGEFTIIGSISASSNDSYTFMGSSNFKPTSGAARYSGLWVATTINQTGGASGTTRGLFVDPTLTSAFDWRSIEWTNSSGWGLYGAGTANNYLGGNLSVGTTGSTARLAVVGSQPSGTTTWTAQFHNALGNSNSLMIRDDGNVGIGTASPAAVLHCNGSFIAGASTTSGLFFSTALDSLSISNQRVLQKSGTQIFIGFTNSVLTFRTNSLERMRITNSGEVGIGTTAPNTSSILELSSTTQGFLSPRMTTAQRDAIVSPATGLELFNTSIGSKQVYNGTEWEILNGARQAITASSSTTSVVFRNGNIADIVLSSSTTLTFSNAAVGTYIVKITQGGSGFNLVSWPANVLWSGGIVPTLTTAVGKTDIFTFVFDSTNYYGSYALNY